ncbi:MAG: ATP-dependent DNA ligase [Fimbriimonadales bacterium]|nr:MAG: ATP-dependent DNA ligase [Fimbriimonadales bacterium]
MSDGLVEYERKRDFSRTPEPRGLPTTDGPRLRYVIQKHAASRLHYDFRLEWQGALKSWAVPKGPSLDPGEKRLAVQVEDHPIDYMTFEGTIPEGEYGAGTVMVWDIGTWEPLGDAEEMLAKGSLKFNLHGERLRGKWALVQIKKDPKNWLLIKERDAWEDSESDVLERYTTSVLSGRTMEEIAAGAPSALFREVRELVRTLPGAVEAEQPRQIEPMLATAVDTPPTGDQYLNEIKYDGFRMLAYLEDGAVRLVSRNGNDYTERFPKITAALENLSALDAILDGEIVVLRPNGTHDFTAVHRAAAGARVGPVVYYVFDIPFCDGFDLRATPLADRKRVLQALLAERPDPLLKYSEHVVGRAQEMFESACELGLEGIVCKRADSAYSSRRSQDWLKIKCANEREFWVCGYTEPEGSRIGFGALILGASQDEEMVYVGRVGTGFRDEDLREIYGLLKELEVTEPTLSDPPKELKTKKPHWTRPELLATVRFASWTNEGTLREPSFVSLRRLEPENADGRADTPSEGPIVLHGVRLTNPDRLLWPEANVTKRDLAEYWLAVWERAKPHLEERPVSLVRCPTGWAGEQFYQKHLHLKEIPEGLTTTSHPDAEEKGEFPIVADVRGLIELAQLNVLEIHPWGARRPDLSQPDRIVFDVDPGPGVEWKRVVETAILLRQFLAELELEAWCKTTGGKGLHVVVPILPEVGWKAVSAASSNVATRLAEAAPQIFTTHPSKDARKGKIYLDTLRNRMGATSVAPYSPRARAGAPVSTPVSWEELPGLPVGGGFTLRSVLNERLSVPDPWARFSESAKSLQPALRRLGVEP